MQSYNSKTRLSWNGQLQKAVPFVFKYAVRVKFNKFLCFYHVNIHRIENGDIGLRVTIDEFTQYPDAVLSQDDKHKSKATLMQLLTC